MPRVIDLPDPPTFLHGLPPLLSEMLTLRATLAQGTGSYSTLELDWPYLLWDWVPIVLLFVAAVVAIAFTWRDTVRFGWGWTAFLSLLRFAFLGTGLAIALNPHIRTQTDAYRESKVVVLLDTSTSMQQAERDQRSTAGEPLTRSAAMLKTLKESALLRELQQQHQVDIYTFDSDLSQVQARLPSQFQHGNETERDETDGSEPQAIDWEQLVASSGHTTRLGDSVDQVLLEAKSPTLAGVVVITDGASNAGRDVAAARNRAETEGVRLIAVGVGSTEPPVNLELTKLIAPTDVQKGDSFELSAIISAQGLASETIQVSLLQQGPNDPEPITVRTDTETLPNEGVLEVVFDLKPSDAGKYEYQVRCELTQGAETRDDDNQLTRSVNIFDRPLKVMIVAGGPMRDYRFARNMLYRHPSVLTDLWLQSGDVGISQEADKLLFRFPDSKEELFQYDVLLAFDPDWSQISTEQQGLIADWISNEGGGMAVVAGDVYTPELAANPDLEQIRKFYPVLLEEVSLRMNTQNAAETPYPVGLTQEGEVAEFLKLAETGDESAWEKFPGVFRCYPTRGAKAGTTIFAEFTDPLSRGPGGQPILIASQRYGQGKVMYIGSPEIWRLREFAEAYVDRFWINTVRTTAEGRSKRGQQRSLFIVEGREFEIGQTIPIRLRALNPQFEPLVAETVQLDVYGPNGNPILPGPQLTRDRIRPSEYVGDFRPLLPGRYRLEFEVPESTERLMMEIDSRLPRQESSRLTQDEESLRRLVTGTQGEYLTLAEVGRIPDLLPNRGESIVIDQQIRELWDRQWLMILLACILAVEWLARKYLKLA